jgi:flagellar biosynthesis/type III secretory pathway protein FliH
MAGMTDAEYEAYERAKMAEQDARGALEKAEEKGEARGVAKGHAAGLEEGRVEELRRSLADLCELLGIEMTDQRRELVIASDLAGLEELRNRIKQQRGWPEEL